MVFQRIDHVHMEYNKKYKIYDRYKGIYKGKRWIGYADPYPGWGVQLEFENVHNLDNHLVSLSMIFSTDVPFYEFLSKKEAIQSCMEYRAVNLILRKIIGDETFSWLT